MGGSLEASGEKQKAEFLAEAVTLSDELRVWKAETPEPVWTPIEELVLKL